MKAAAMETAKAGSPPERTGSRKSAMIEPTKSAGTHPRRCARSAGSIEVLAVGAKIIAIDDRSAVRDVGIVVVDDSPGAVPVVTPMVPSPAKAAEESNSEAEAEADPGV